MRLIDCTVEEHGEAVRAIMNEAIANSTAHWDYEPKDTTYVNHWMAEKLCGGYPFFGAIGEAGELLGYAYYGPYNTRDGYQHTVEHSVYVDARYRGQGVGTFLVNAITQHAYQAGYFTLVGGIDGENVGSIRFHEKLGFEKCGHLRRMGWKFDRWLDVLYYQKFLRDGDPE